MEYKKHFKPKNDGKCLKYRHIAQIDGILPKGSTRHAYAWQVGPFWQDTLEICIIIYTKGQSCHGTRDSSYGVGTACVCVPLVVGKHGVAADSNAMVIRCVTLWTFLVFMLGYSGKKVNYIADNYQALYFACYQQTWYWYCKGISTTFAICFNPSRAKRLRWNKTYVYILCHSPTLMWDG